MTDNTNIIKEATEFKNQAESAGFRLHIRTTTPGPRYIPYINYRGSKIWEGTSNKSPYDASMEMLYQLKIMDLRASVFGEDEGEAGISCAKCSDVVKLENETFLPWSMIDGDAVCNDCKELYELNTFSPYVKAYNEGKISLDELRQHAKSIGLEYYE